MTRQTDDQRNEEPTVAEPENQTGRMHVNPVPETIRPRSAEDKRRTYEKAQADERERRLARDLIGYVEQRLDHETGLLQWRIQAALDYMSVVQTPNEHTLNHVRRYLAGDLDNER